MAKVKQTQKTELKKTQVARKVLLRDDAGTCVLLLKQHWKNFIQQGKTKAIINGRSYPARVIREKCTCGGHPEHEHRFLVLPDSFKKQETVTLTIS